MNLRRWFQACQTEMMTLFGQTVRTSPALPTREEQLLRARLMFEECGLEMIEASACRIRYVGHIPIYPGMFLQANDLEVVALEGQQADEVKVADAIADGLVVTFGAANTYGQDAEGIYDEVHRSNMTKVWPDGTIHKREDGKVLKPDTYSPADLAGELERQRIEATQERLAEAALIEEGLASPDDPSLPQNCDEDGKLFRDQDHE